MSELEEYRRKRDLEKSGEPEASLARAAGSLIFVVQKHRARQLHYDLRLEVDGVLKSWAVPKGPSLDPAQKRLAAAVEDHPVDYASFEGAIPKGEYGAGEVIVWDNGTYSPDEGGKLLFGDRAEAQSQMRRGIEQGKLSFFLRGHKLRGSYTLVRVRGREKDWLLIKHQDEYARDDTDVLKAERSVLSGRTLDDIRAGTAPAPSSLPSLDPAAIEGARRAAFPDFVPPMLASTADAPFSSPSWAFEPKLDGYRIIATLRDGKAALWSRRGNNVTDTYPLLVPPLQRQPASELVLDGELVALDAAGHVSFACLQQYRQPGQSEECGDSRLIYYVFDILHIDGYNLRPVKLRSRRHLLTGILHESPGVRLVESFDTDGNALFQAAIKNGLEGVIAKRVDSEYESGRRSPDWLKVKAVHTGDFIVAGYTAGEGNRSSSLGSLLLGYLDDQDRLVFAGRVGSGFDERSLSAVKIRLDGLRQDRSPFPEVPESETAAFWVRPELVAEVKYSQWTRDGRLRAPVFLRLRDDKPVSEVRRAETVPAPAPTTATPVAFQAPDELLERLSTPKTDFTIEVDGHEIKLSHVDKVFWPATESHPPITKRHFLDYLARVSPYLLPHLKDRPLTLSRYPDGIHGEHFWQKHWNHPLPDFVRTVSIYEEKGKAADYIVCNDLATLMWLGQAADIEFHTWFSRTSPQPDMSGNRDDVDHVLDYPDFIVFDLDPYLYSGHEAPGSEPELNRAAFARTCQAARWLKEVLDSLSLTAFLKTSGKTGLHLYVPITRQLEYAAVRRAAETIGQFVMRKHPEDITMEWATEKRRGKVFIDYAQNVRGKTLASVYSPRPGPEAGVSFPLSWDRLDKAYPTDFTILTVPTLLKQDGDAWAGILQAKRSIDASLRQAGKP